MFTTTNTQFNEANAPEINLNVPLVFIRVIRVIRGSKIESRYFTTESTEITKELAISQAFRTKNPFSQAQRILWILTKDYEPSTKHVTRFSAFFVDSVPSVVRK